MVVTGQVLLCRAPIQLEGAEEKQTQWTTSEFSEHAVGQHQAEVREHTVGQHQAEVSEYTVGQHQAEVS